MAVQEEMCVIFIANTTQAKWADAVKVMAESVFVERTKLHTKFRQTPDTYYIANTIHSSFNGRMVDSSLLLNAARDLAFFISSASR